MVLKHLLLNKQSRKAVRDFQSRTITEQTIKKKIKITISWINVKQET